MLKRKSFLQAKDGVAAVEFAFIAPIVILMFFGLIELSQGMNCRQRMESVAGTVADLVAQSTKITDADRTNIFNAAGAIMFPFSDDDMEIVITSVVDNGTNNGVGRVAWSEATANTTARSTGSTVPSGELPAGLITGGGSVIMAEVKYTFHSPAGFIIGQPIEMTGRFFSRPRRSLTVARTAT